MDNIDHQKIEQMKYLVIGAGPCGLVIAKFLKDAGIEYEQAEADDDIGGNWYHGVYQSVFTDADKSTMEFPFFPMPKDYPHFLSKKQMLKYYQDFADHFTLRNEIRFNTTVSWIEAIEENKWKVYFQDGSSYIYKGVIICNGHHWDMQFPQLPGNFSGELIHSKQYKTPSQLLYKRVLVIGSRNSAVDIVCEAARSGRSAVLSVRDSPWIMPKAFMGKPLSKYSSSLPDFIKPILSRLLVRLTFGKHQYYNMPDPKHKLFSKLPTMSEELPYYLRHGRVIVKPAIKNIIDNTVIFDDNSSQEFDLIIAATGYKLSFPFLPKELSRTDENNLLCYGYSAYKDYKGLFFFGWPQVIGGIGILSSSMAKGLIDLIRLEECTEQPSGKVLEEMGDQLSNTYRPTANQIFQWVAKHSLAKMMKAAAIFKNEVPHRNQLTAELTSNVNKHSPVY